MCPPVFLLPGTREETRGHTWVAPYIRAGRSYIAKILSIASDVRLMSVGSQGIISAVQGPS